jgi:hypothetical protein
MAGRKLVVAWRHTPQEVFARYRAERDGRLTPRRHNLKLLRQGRSLRETATLHRSPDGNYAPPISVPTGTEPAAMTRTVPPTPPAQPVRASGPGARRWRRCRRAGRSAASAPARA